MKHQIEMHHEFLAEHIHEVLDEAIEAGLPQIITLRDWTDVNQTIINCWHDIRDDYSKIGIKFDAVHDPNDKQVLVKIL